MIEIVKVVRSKGCENDPDNTYLKDSAGVWYTVTTGNPDTMPFDTDVTIWEK